MDTPGKAPMTRRRLVIMRHGEALPTAPSDLVRELTERGRADATVAGEWLAASGIVLDHALVSGAVRTRSTWDAVAAGAGCSLEPDIRLDLYTASPEVALDEIRLVPPTAETVLLVGHNPTASYLASLLQDGVGDPGTLTQMMTGFPPATMVVLEWVGEWSALSFGDMRVLHYRSPR